MVQRESGAPDAHYSSQKTFPSKEEPGAVLVQGHGRRTHRANPRVGCDTGESSTDLILFNGKVFTSNASQPYVEALAIRGDRIVAVGTSKEVVALASKETRRIDLGGRTVIPGVNDAQIHLGVEPSHYDLPPKSNDPTWQQMTDALAAAAPKVAKRNLD